MLTLREYANRNKLRAVCINAGLTPEIYSKYVVLSRNNISIFTGSVVDAIDFAARYRLDNYWGYQWQK